MVEVDHKLARQLRARGLPVRVRSGVDGPVFVLLTDETVKVGDVSEARMRPYVLNRLLERAKHLRW